MPNPLIAFAPVAPDGDRRRGPIQPVRPAGGVFGGWGPKL
jgi:hypothetical protein